MNEYGEKAANFSKQGFNCSQSVLGALSDFTGLDDCTAKAISSGFGGGVRCGEVCGAVAGGAMALGAALGRDCDGSKTAKSALAVNELTNSFNEKYGCLRCADLIADAGKSKCVEFMSYCAIKCAEILKENNK